MNSRIKFLGHPLHPMLVVFPIGLLSTAVILDLIFTGNGNRALTTASYWMITAGLIGGVLAAVVGFLEWFAVPNNSRAKTVGLWHGLGNLVVTLLFFGSWWLRTDVEDYVPNSLAMILSLAGFGLALVTAWLGGELVYRLGIGVDHGANANAPSSLSNREASTVEGAGKHSGRTTR